MSDITATYLSDITATFLTHDCLEVFFCNDDVHAKILGSSRMQDF